MRNKKFGISIVLFLVVVLVSGTRYSAYVRADGVDEAVQSRTIEKISSKEGYELILENKDNPDFVIMDVRTPKEYAGGHIEGAVNVDFLSDIFQEEIGNLDKSKTYMVNCNSGRKSSSTLAIMDELGFQHVYDIGGIIEWKENGYPVVK